MSQCLHVKTGVQSADIYCHRASVNWKIIRPNNILMKKDFADPIRQVIDIVFSNRPRPLPQRLRGGQYNIDPLDHLFLELSDIRRNPTELIQTIGQAVAAQAMRHQIEQAQSNRTSTPEQIYRIKACPF